ncbi:MAG: ABC transporter permease [Pseudomonadota bacterium]
MSWLIAVLVVWAIAWVVNIALSRLDQGWTRIAVPILFGLTLVFIWEGFVRGFEVNPIILPAPSAIGSTLINNVPTIWADLVQTFFKGALSGYVIGCAAGILAAIAVDRSPFLQRGLLPVGNFLAALPIVGMAPILVIWFGFGWQSKAAVVVVMVFFPMLVNTIEGLRASDPMQRDLMHTYAASYGQSLRYLRLPAAMPFVFNGLKICTPLALIGAIVAEFFGSPTVGMGFRISTEVGRLALDMVWAEITVAAIVGSAFYGLMALLERQLSFWHPSHRR